MRLSDLNLSSHQQELDQVKTQCPICSANRKKTKEPCLSVNLSDGVYYCWNCGSTGTLDGFSGTRFASSKRKVYIKPNAEEMSKLDTVLDGPCLDYFSGRGITKASLQAFGVTYGVIHTVKKPDGTYEVDEEGIPLGVRGIRYPFFENGELVNVKTFRPKEWTPDGIRKIAQTAGGKPIPFGLDNAIDPEDSLVIVEGEIDALSVWPEHKQVWSVPNGSNGYTWLELDCVVEKMLLVKNIILAGDNDEPGLEMREELIRRLSLLLGIEKLLICTWPEDCKDANDVLKTYGFGKISECILDSVAIPVDGISDIDEFMEDYMNFYRNGMPTGVSTGISTLDPLYKVMPGMVTVVTGVPNHGKSELLDEIVRVMNQNDSRHKFAYYTPENHPQSLHMIKLAQKFIGKPFDNRKPGAMTEDEAFEAAQWMSQNIFYINPRGKAFSVDEILDRARILIYRHGIFGLVIDPWNYVRKDFGTLREDQYINQELQKLSIFAKQHKIHIWLVVHPRTLRKDKDGNIQTPTMYDLSGGSKFGDNADSIFAVERYPKEAFATQNHRVTVHVQKVRYRPAGQQGSVDLHWEPFNGRFKESTPPTIGEDPDGNIYIEDEEQDAKF